MHMLIFKKGANNYGVNAIYCTLINVAYRTD